MLLDDIIFAKRQEVCGLKARQSKLCNYNSRRTVKTRNFASIFKKGKIAVIAEIKRASPSSGLILKSFDPKKLAKQYARSGAAAISVLTDKKYFKGDNSHLMNVKKTVKLPVLRKDFIIDAAQVVEARQIGADAVLLIARILSLDELVKLLAICKKLKLEALVEVHDEEDVKKALQTKARVIGINNRDLDSLKIDLNTTIRLLKQFPALKQRKIVSESGIRSRADVIKLRSAGVNGILVGTSLLKGKTTIKELIGI
jgi:indole-3-glycerol phosphate synthase